MAYALSEARGARRGFSDIPDHAITAKQLQHNVCAIEDCLIKGKGYSFY
jgi:hypothetical protein